jgi:hypothetical protein
MSERETVIVASHFVMGADLGPQTKLIIEIFLRFADGSEVKADALVDTGAEISLVRKGLVDNKYFRRSNKPKRFVTANEGILDGGLMEVPCDLIFWGVCLRTDRPVGVVCPCSLYDANINVDVILSYEWLGRMKMDVNCQRHGLMVARDLSPVWVSGVRESQKRVAAADVRAIQGFNSATAGVVDMDASEELGDYTVRWPVVHEIIKGLGVEPHRDCFAAEGNQRFSKFWTMEDDALTKNWCQGEVLWFNPPWRLWPQVAEKLLQSTCEAVCVMPAWCKTWMQNLLRAANKRMYFEAGNRIFEIFGRPAPNTRWGVWALYFPSGDRILQDKERVFSDCIFIPRWRPLRAMGMAEEFSEDGGDPPTLVSGGFLRRIPNPGPWIYFLVPVVCPMNFDYKGIMWFR